MVHIDLVIRENPFAAASLVTKFQNMNKMKRTEKPEDVQKAEDEFLNDNRPRESGSNRYSTPATVLLPRFLSYPYR